MILECINFNEISIATVGNNKYYIYRCEGKLKDIENTVVLINKLDKLRVTL